MFQIYTRHQTETKKQQINLITHLAMMTILINGIFWLMNWVIVTYIPPEIFISLLLISLITLILNKKGQYRIAAIFGLTFFNIAVYCLASSETTETGMHMYLGATAFAAFVIFGYEQRYLSFGFLIFSVLLFFACFFSDYSPLPERNFTPQEISSFFIINALSFIIICTYLFYLVLWVNFVNEKSLRENENRMILQNEQLKKTNTELDRFVYSASHDLRAPLSSLSGLITISEASNKISELKDYLTMMKGRVAVLDKFIIDIINYSRNARQEVVWEKINLHNLISDIVEGLKYSIESDVITIQNLIPTEIEIITDSTRIRIILNNLVSNAIRYHDKYKDNCLIQIDETLSADQIVINVKDNGIGIPEEHQDKIFNMFFKATGNSSGSGLGLYIAQESINKLGGTIEMQSEYGVGSTFSIILPIHDVDKNS
jgi:signal transduction histidine kinase